MQTMVPPEQIPAERFERIDERFDRVDERLVEVDRRITETAKETDRRLKEVDRRITETAKETNRRLAGLEEAQVELRQQMSSLHHLVHRGNITQIAGLAGVIAAILARGG
ncbi:MAG TPA: hypothetical protein VFI17_09305 [Solirubrobacterales bacterium]|nr:hypothetical protein [Solirubrobacterales bacterium]